MPHANMRMGDDGILRVSFIGDTGKQGAEAFINIRFFALEQKATAWLQARG